MLLVVMLFVEAGWVENAFFYSLVMLVIPFRPSAYILRLHNPGLDKVKLP